MGLKKRKLQLGRACAQALSQASDVVDARKPFASPHEMHSVILEEVCEFFDEVRKQRHMRSPLRMREELLDIAVAALRAASEMELYGDPTQCDPCEGNGWLHMNDSMGCGPGIEACDDCGVFETDADAARAHAVQCGCGLQLARHRSQGDGV